MVLLVSNFIIIPFLGIATNKDVSQSSDHSHCFHILVQRVCNTSTALSPVIFNTSAGISSYSGLLLLLRLSALKLQIQGGFLIDRGVGKISEIFYTGGQNKRGGGILRKGLNDYTRTEKNKNRLS